MVRAVWKVYVETLMVGVGAGNWASLGRSDTGEGASGGEGDWLELR